MLLSYISTNYTPYHAKTSVYYVSHKRNINLFYHPSIAELVDRFFQEEDNRGCYNNSDILARL